MGQPNIGQALNLMAVFGNNADWSSLDASRIQRVIDNPREAGLAFTKWLANDCRLAVKGPSALVVDRSKPFDPVKFIGQGWSIVEEDKSSLAFTEIDFSKVRFESGLKEGESVIDGEEKLERLKRLSSIRLDAKVGQMLYEEKGQPTLRFIHEYFGVSWFELAGTVLRRSDGDRCFLYLRRFDGGSWDWRYRWLDDDRDRDFVSPLLATHFISLPAFRRASFF